MRRLITNNVVTGQYKKALRKLYRSCLKTEPEKVLDISEYHIGGGKQVLTGEYLGSVQVSEGIFKRKEHIYEIYRTGKTIKYIDYV